MVHHHIKNVHLLNIPRKSQKLQNIFVRHLGQWRKLLSEVIHLKNSLCYHFDFCPGPLGRGPPVMLLLAHFCSPLFLFPFQSLYPSTV